MHLTNGSNRSLRSLGRAKARPLTKRYGQMECHEEIYSVLVWNFLFNCERSGNSGS
jgi:hypothetical protein